MSLLKRLWRWLTWYESLPCPQCAADLRDQPGAFHGDGLRGGERHYTCQCGRYVVYCERTDGPWRLLYDREDGFYTPYPRREKGGEIEIHHPPTASSVAPAEQMPKWVWMGVFTVLDGTVRLPDGSFTRMGPGRGLVEIQREWFEKMAAEKGDAEGA